MRLLTRILLLVILLAAELNVYAQEYTPHIASTNCFGGGPLSPIAGDIDLDGDLDIVYYCSNGTIRWMRNDGLGNFNTDGFGSFHYVSPDWQGLVDVRIEDMDGYEDLDIIASFDFFDRITWYPNDGTGQFGTQQFAEEIVVTSETEPWDIHLADLDDDGDMDILAIDFYEDDITWYQNNGGGYFFQAGQLFISSQLNAPSSIKTADFDGDNDLDILVSYYLGDRISWFRNDGSESFSSPITVTTEVDGPTFIAAEDIDGDGDIDVFSKSLLDDKTVWYANDGTGAFGNQVLLSQSGDLWDMDADGDVDLLSSLNGEQEISWLENNQGEFVISHVVTSEALGNNLFYPADLDGDGDTDIISSDGSTNQITWYENNGVAIEPFGLGDFDGDGFVNVYDFAYLLSLFGQDCPALGDCLLDLDDDGSIGLGDLSIFLGAFGSVY